MTKSRAETAVQTVVPRSGKITKSEPAPEAFVPEVTIPESSPPPQFDELVLEDEGIELVEEEMGSAPPPTVAGAPASRVEDVLEHLRVPLEEALRTAERVHAAEGQVDQWVDGQAKRRLVRLALRLSEELRATEAKRAGRGNSVLPPVPRRESEIRDLLDHPKKRS